MSGPWEDYAVGSGPWQDYASKPAAPSGHSAMVTSNPGEYDTNSPEYKAKYGPTGGYLQTALESIGGLYTDVGLGARQIYGQAMDHLSGPNLSSLITGKTRTQQLEQEAADKREIDAPLNAAPGSTVGKIVGGLPLAFIPGANSYAGAALIGGGLGATQPTVGNESRLLNTGLGVGMGVAGKYAGDKLSAWITERAAQPFTGWRQATGNQAAAQSVGSEASALTQPEIAAQHARLGGIFNQARDANVSINMTGQTAGEISNAAQGLNQSSRVALEGNSEVTDLMAHLRNGTANAEQLGAISSRLGKEAAAQMKGQTGDRALGQALFAIKEHVDDLVGGSITDPALATAYSAARGQYRNLITLTSRPTILNSSTGDLNMRNLGNYLQKYDQVGFTRGGNTSPLYEAARFGQRSGLGSKPSPPILQPMKWLSYHLNNSALLGSMGGIASRLGEPISPVIKYGLPGAAEISAPVALPYLTQ